MRHAASQSGVTSRDAIAESLAGLDVDATVRERLSRYVELLLERNVGMNLTAAREPAAVAGHIADSLTLAPFVADPLVDIGSGGGFPGIPLALATGVRVTLIESVAKKAKFLAEVATALELPLRVICMRAEDAGRAPALRAQFASATARAVGSLPTVLELAVPLLAVGGVAVLQRGRLESPERSAATDAALVLGAGIEREVWLGEAAEARARAREPEPDAGRRLLIVRKLVPTGQRFPRRAGIPAKRPLCYAVAPANAAPIPTPAAPAESTAPMAPTRNA